MRPVVSQKAEKASVPRIRYQGQRIPDHAPRTTAQRLGRPFRWLDWVDGGSGGIVRPGQCWDLTLGRVRLKDSQRLTYRYRLLFMRNLTAPLQTSASRRP